MRFIEIKEASCPPATQDLAINTKNRDACHKEYNYGPLNFDFPGDYWEKVANHWDTTEEAAKESLCGTCVAFDISPRMEECMPGQTSDEHGKLGYCWMHHFKCHSARTCHTWAKGGPITDDKVSLDWGKRANMNEGEYRDNDVEEFVPNDAELDKIKNKFLPDWEMLDHREIQTMYVCQDHRQAEEMIGFINDLSEKMDHFAEVTQDVTEVKVKTSTFDVKGLTVLDFQLAMQIDAWAEEKDIKQASTSGNFGMHEDQDLTEAQFDEAAGEKDACYHKVKSRYKVWPSAYASGALSKCRKVGAKNWGNSKKK